MSFKAAISLRLGVPFSWIPWISSSKSQDMDLVFRVSVYLLPVEITKCWFYWLAIFIAGNDQSIEKDILSKSQGFNLHFSSSSGWR